MKRTLQDYKSEIKPVWCPGCGDYGVLTGLQKALLELEISPENLITVSGIGCSGRLSHYLNSYSIHGTHGRALPTAVGAKTARPESTVIVAGGDGDGLGIGGGHISPVARKNVDITYLLIDNRIYGLTKGQSSPTTPIGTKTKTTPYGVYESILDVLPIFLAYDVSFIARTISSNIKEVTQIIKAAIQHKGFSIVYILSPCVTFPIINAKDLKNAFKPLTDDFNRNNKMLAMEKAYSHEPLYSGIFYQRSKPTLEDQLNECVMKACKENGGKVQNTTQLLNSFV
jgi:2-oxoglutarate/2-oxoacid ferredoxin oxidoreductase subunit beta